MHASDLLLLRRPCARAGSILGLATSPHPPYRRPDAKAGRSKAAGFIRSGRLLLVVIDFAELRVDDVVLGLPVAAWAGAAVARRSASSLLGLIHGLAELHLRLH